MSKVRCYSCREYVQKTTAKPVNNIQYWCGLCPRKYASKPKKTARLNVYEAEFKKLRPKIVNRDKVCRSCGVTGVHVHHIYYRSEGGTNDLLNLLLLCNKCHDIVHSNKRFYQPLLLGLVWLFYVEGKRLTSAQFVSTYSHLLPKVK